MGSPTLKQADRSKSIMGYKGERLTARTFASPLANKKYLAVAPSASDPVWV